MSAPTDAGHATVLTKGTAAAIAVTAAAILYVLQSLFGAATMGSLSGVFAPSWGSAWWIAGVLVYAGVLALTLPRPRIPSGLTTAFAMLGWLLPPALGAMLAAPDAVAALNVGALVVLFAFTFHGSGWIALPLVGGALLLRVRASRSHPMRDRKDPA